MSIPLSPMYETSIGSKSSADKCNINLCTLLNLIGLSSIIYHYLTEYSILASTLCTKSNS